MMDFRSLADVEIDIIYDMFDKWADYAHHGELQDSYGYDESAISAFYSLNAALRGGMKRRRRSF